MKAEWTNSDSLTTSQTTKAILVIDMPKACADGCPVMCRARGINHRPTWCPLRPLPQEREVNMMKQNEYEVALNEGWNACIDEILGEIE